MKKEELENLAKSIAEMEKEMRLGKSVQDFDARIENLIQDLTLEDLFLIDEYIQKLLT